jgi:DNA-binding SARP family transcriptional activator
LIWLERLLVAVGVFVSRSENFNPVNDSKDHRRAENLTAGKVAPWRKLFNLLSAGEKGRAYSLFSKIKGDLKRHSQTEDLAWGQLASAAVLYACGQIEQGLEWLEVGLANCRQKSLVDNPSWRLPGIADLCLAALQSDIETDFVQTVISKNSLVPSRSPGDLKSWPWPVRIYTLGRFAVVKDGGSLQFKRKAQKRPIELLQALIALGGRSVSQIRLEDALWQNVPGASAKQSFNMALYRLRKLIGGDCLQLHDHKLTLNPCCCWVDVWAFERRLHEAEGLLRDPSISLDKLLQLTTETIDLLQGTFLGNEVEQSWVLPLREKLRHRVGRLFKDLGRHCGKAGQCEKAISLYRKALEVDPLDEEFYRRLMICYGALDRFPEALATYHYCRKNFALRLNVRPSSATEALLKAIELPDKSVFLSACTVRRTTP